MPFAGMVCGTLNKMKEQNDTKGIKRVNKAIKVMVLLGIVLVIILFII